MTARGCMQCRLSSALPMWTHSSEHSSREASCYSLLAGTQLASQHLGTKIQEMGSLHPVKGCLQQVESLVQEIVAGPLGRGPRA